MWKGQKVTQVMSIGDLENECDGAQKAYQFYNNNTKEPSNEWSK